MGIILWHCIFIGNFKLNKSHHINVSHHHRIFTCIDDAEVIARRAGGSGGPPFSFARGRSVYKPLTDQWLAVTTAIVGTKWEIPGSMQSHPKLTFQSCSRCQLHQLGSKAASESTFKRSNTADRVSKLILDLTLHQHRILASHQYRILIACTAYQHRINITSTSHHINIIN